MFAVIKRYTEGFKIKRVVLESMHAQGGRGPSPYYRRPRAWARRVEMAKVPKAVRYYWGPGQLLQIRRYLQSCTWWGAMGLLGLSAED